MQSELAAIYHELQRLQRCGERTVSLSDDTLRWLRAEAAERKAGPALPPLVPIEVPAEEKAAAPMATQAMPSPPVPPPEPQLPEGDKSSRWQALRQMVIDDAWCQSQLKPGKQVVFGCGNLDAAVFFCGEAPGAEEEVQGEPFVGPAGDLLTKIIGAMGLRREDVYIGNIMNYRPPMPSEFGNRPPTPAEMAYCLPYLRAQLQIVQPQVVVALGKTAVDGLLGPDPKRRLGSLRGKWQELDGTGLMVTYHPSYLLRKSSNTEKRKVWEDMMLVMERLGMPVSAKQRSYFL
jgi:DNA polymerase